MHRSLLILVAAFAALALPTTASAVTVSKASLSAGQLRVEGSNAAPGIFTTAESTTSAAGIRSDTKGQFKIQATNFTAPDCTIVVSDRQTPSATVRISGCTPTTVPVTTPPPASSGTCRLVTPAGATTFTRNTNSTLYFPTTGCATNGFGDLRFVVTGGSIPVGMSGPNLQGPDSANIIGTPTLAGTYTFQLQVTDRLGQTDFENYTIVVA
ncbi:MAG: putative Ig protein [Thermoleophilia bacterium]|nr:putative Ig protein [Thermoleophilia bacterium]